MASKKDPIKKLPPDKNGKVRYRFVIDVGRREDGGRDQRTFTFDSYKEARDERARLISERAQGKLVKPNKKLTVDEYLAQWLESKQDKKPGTVVSYTDALKRVREAYGKLPLQALDVPHIEKLKRVMLSSRGRRRGTPGKPVAARTVNAMLTVLSLALKAAMRRRLVTHNVADLVDRVPSDPTAGKNRAEWDTEHAIAFLRSVADERLYAAWLLSMLGLRRGEVLGLTWDAVDLTGDQARSRKLPPGTPSLAILATRVYVYSKTIPGTPKSRAGVRTLPLPDPVVKALKAFRARQAREKLEAGSAYSNEANLVVVNELGVAPGADWYSANFVRLAKRAGLPRIPLHGARHTTASLLGDLGFPDVVAAAWLGHSQVTITHGYQHAMNERMRAAGEALGDTLAS